MISPWPVHCVEGFYSDDGKECVECEVGKYKNFTGNTACVDCPSGFETNGKGKTSLVDCALCEFFYILSLFPHFTQKSVHMFKYMAQIHTNYPE